MLPNLEQVTRDGGTGLAKGVALVNAQRQSKAGAGGRSRRSFSRVAGRRRGLAQGGVAGTPSLCRGGGGGESVGGRATGKARRRRAPAVRARHAWQKAEKAMDAWHEQERLWQQTKEALPLITPDGELEHAGAGRKRCWPRRCRSCPTAISPRPNGNLQKPEMLNYLDRVQQQIAALPFAGGSQAGGGAAGRRCVADRKLLKGENPQAAARRGVLLMCAVVLGKAGAAGQQAVTAVRDILSPRLPGQQLGGVHQQRAAHAAGRHRKHDARPAGPQAAVLELPHVPHRPPPRHDALPASGRAVAGGPTLVGRAQINT